MIEKYNRPILFYALSIIIPWALWFVTAYVSHLEPTTFYRITRDVLGIAGLISPMIVAFALMIPDKDLRRDLKMKLFHFRNTKTIYLILTCTLMLASILAAQAVSLLFRSEEHTSELQSRFDLVCRLLLENKNRLERNYCLNCS